MTHGSSSRRGRWFQRVFGFSVDALPHKPARSTRLARTVAAEMMVAARVNPSFVAVSGRCREPTASGSPRFSSSPPRNRCVGIDTEQRNFVLTPRLPTCAFMLVAVRLLASTSSNAERPVRVRWVSAMSFFVETRIASVSFTAYCRNSGTRSIAVRSGAFGTCRRAASACWSARGVGLR
jgi:hypothetical protein